MDPLIDFFLNFYGPMPYVIVFLVLLACGLGFPLPEDITLIAAGIICYYGAVSSVTLMVLICLLAVLGGDLLIFVLGAHYGRKLTKRWPFNRFLTEDRLKFAKEKFNKKGHRFIFAARFMPGLRAPIYFSAGMLHVQFRHFLLYDGLAALISVPTIVLLVYSFGDQLDLIAKKIQRVEHGIVIVVLAAVLLSLMKWILKRKKEEKAKTGR